MRKPDLTLPYPPSSNRYWRMAGSRLYVSAEATAYRKQVNAIVSLLPIDYQRYGDIGIRLHFYRPRCSGDLDNRIKVVLDCLQGYLYADDKQVQKIIAERFEDKKSPRLEIWVMRENEDEMTLICPMCKRLLKQIGTPPKEGEPVECGLCGNLWLLAPKAESENE